MINDASNVVSTSLLSKITLIKEHSVHFFNIYCWQKNQHKNIIMMNECNGLNKTRKLFLNTLFAQNQESKTVGDVKLPLNAC